MRKLFSLTLALALVLTMTACSGPKEGSSSSKGLDEVASYTAETVQSLVEAGVFSEELENLDADTAFALYKLADYGLERENLTDAFVLRSAGATCEEGAVLTFDGEEKAELAKGALEDYVSAQKSANEDYRPSEIPKLEEALVAQSGESLLLLIANDQEIAERVLNP